MFFIMVSFQEPKTNPINTDELKKLNWLVGEWIDQDDDVDLILSYTWDENKHFLTNKFSIQSKDQKVLSGKQIITWDPANKRFRSWMFDSDGGFGQGEWRHKDNKWIVETSQTLPDGARASAINIYKKIDDDSYSFESVGRMVDGEMLPDIDPVTVIRKKD